MFFVIIAKLNSSILKVLFLHAETILFTLLRAFYKVRTRADTNSSARFGIPLIWLMAGCNPCRIINNHDLYNFIHLSVVKHVLFYESKKSNRQKRKCEPAASEKNQTRPGAADISNQRITSVSWCFAPQLAAQQSIRTPNLSYENWSLLFISAEK